MRLVYSEELADLATSMARMCSLATDDMELATHALLQVDLVAAEKVLQSSSEMSRLATENEERGFALLALQAPVARDLRQVVTSIQLVQDLVRMGTLAGHVAKIVRRRHPEPVLPEPVNGYLAEMGRVAVALGRSATEVLLNRDPEQAATLAQQDDAVDDLRRHLFTLLTVREWKWGVACAVDVTLLGRYYERFADHAVEVAQRVIFLATGEYATTPESDPEEPSPSSEELVRRFNETDRAFKQRMAQHEPDEDEGSPQGS
ncbi:MULTISPECIES: phosphate signaling complex protein PhoU [Dietzia]|uniref:PhoU-like phosphate uptake regulator n=1 Tax=Dietzia cinnamea TaxID=321318 RepID=A0A4R3ZRA1_9ACTN|nr:MULTISPECIES: phosphate signaling complex protein PhoU [Dietzia]KZO60547.1 phosphate transport system regulatory protein PhoU [Dietzia maris]AVM64641.1 phosphate transport system regulatory protein PhoU [Dietzia sp. oral taxon 368]MBM7229777.1 phosphate signaling complex protein PhoU [Dietzia cinnamea]MCT1712902.1 phosphate signaling complex protein PhoU [Dietzia cinnamea]MCT1864658.1 phosphate signaling complex protein PhoU [Dietzia cinnamea]